MNQVKPISPEDIASKKSEIIPGDVIEVVNKLIAKNFSSGQSVVLQSEIIDEILAIRHIEEGIAKYTRDMIFKEGYLDFEAIYEAVGWRVVYDKPGYNEDYKARFEFTSKKCK